LNRSHAIAGSDGAVCDERMRDHFDQALVHGSNLQGERLRARRCGQRGR
jgi:hypothetical protein